MSDIQMRAALLLTFYMILASWVKARTTKAIYLVFAAICCIVGAVS